MQRDGRPHKDFSVATSSTGGTITGTGVSPAGTNSNIHFSYNGILAEKEDRIWYVLMQLITRALVMSSAKLLYLQRTCLLHSWIATFIITLWEAQEVLPLLALSGSVLSKFLRIYVCKFRNVLCNFSWPCEQSKQVYLGRLPKRKAKVWVWSPDLSSHLTLIISPCCWAKYLM